MSEKTDITLDALISRLNNLQDRHGIVSTVSDRPGARIAEPMTLTVDVQTLDTITDMIESLRNAGLTTVQTVKLAGEVLRAQSKEVKRMLEALRTMRRKYIDPAPPQVQPKRLGVIYLCPECHRRIGANHSYCHSCGKRIQWQPESPDTADDGAKEVRATSDNP